MSTVGQFIDFFHTRGFMPHGMCLLWKPAVLWTMVFGDVMTALAYFSIPLTLIYFILKKTDVGFKWIFVLFGIFIFFCGLTHVMHVVTLWKPLYGLEALVLAFTGIVSMMTAILLWPTLPLLFKIPSPWTLEKINEALDKSNKELERSNQSKTQFFSNVSHELRTPLMLILGPLEKLLTDKEAKAGQLKDLNLIHANARILLKHVNDLLDIAKIDAGKMLLNYENVDLSLLIKKTSALFETNIAAQHLKFTVDVPEKLIVQIDPDKFQRIIMNLLSNAVKFTPEYGEIFLKLSKRNDKAIITVKNSGPGIPIEAQENIFDRFFQVEDSSTRRYGGTGLGLAITKDLVSLHNGSITLENPSQGGVCFKIEVPLKAPLGALLDTDFKAMSNSDNVTAIVTELHEQNKIKKDFKDFIPKEENLDSPLVLVVEDNKEMNHYICDSISAKYRTVSAFDGHEGLLKARSLHPDLILSDIMMPNMSGVQLVKELRKHASLLSTPIIILTAKADDNLCIQMLKEGAQDFMLKPFSAEELKARIANLIRTKRVEDELERFVYLASHDLKAPLPAMEKLIRWIEEDSPKGTLSTESRKHLTLLERRARRMSNLLDGLIKYNQANYANCENVIVDSKSLVLGIIKQLNLPESYIFEVAEDLPTFKTCKTALEQVFTILIENSIKHHGKKLAHIEIGFKELPKYFKFSVKDDGPGIEPEFQAKIFQLFQTLQPRDVLESGGVGLSIAKKIVNSLSGKIGVESEVNRGTNFWFTWPKK